MSKTDNATRASLLVIGCGNTLRGDDAAGFEVARSVEAWGLENLRALPVHQLTPELAQDLMSVDEVVFVDASCEDRSLRIQSVGQFGDPLATASAVAHSMSPSALLSFTRQVYGHSPRAWLIGIPAFSFDRPDDISPSTRQSMDEAVAWIRKRIQAHIKEYVPCMN